MLLSTEKENNGKYEKKNQVDVVESSQKTSP